MGKHFRDGAWLYSGFDEELTEEEFIDAAGGLEALMDFRGFPFVSLVMEGDMDMASFQVGHHTGESIGVVMLSNGHRKWQTMEWK